MTGPRRAACPRCARPAATCLCALAAPTPNALPVLVLQHPREAREAKGSARLLALSLARCRVEIGERFDDARLHALLHAEGRRSVLLYPVVELVPAPASIDGAPPTQLVVLDGTWRKCLRMLLAHPLLQALPRQRLRSPPDSAYRSLRKAPRAGLLSTLEATALALGELEQAPARYDALRRAFAAFVADGAARQTRSAAA